MHCQGTQGPWGHETALLILVVSEDPCNGSAITGSSSRDEAKLPPRGGGGTGWRRRGI